MNILITSGGTSENIDQVRSITNHSTGRLGALIADTFLAQGAQVTLVTTKKAIKPPPHPNLHLILIDTVAQLLDTLEPLVKTHHVLIHAMAVSDYTPIYMTGFQEVETATNLSEFLSKKNQENKISSADDYQVLFLQKTPKIIQQIKKWNPAIYLVGFKLLVDVSKEELLTVARASLSKNKADMIVANDLVDISQEQHIAYLVEKDSEIKVYSKQEIAQSLFEAIQRKEKG